jgi:hypothetical protein
MRCAGASIYLPGLDPRRPPGIHVLRPLARLGLSPSIRLRIVFPIGNIFIGFLFPMWNMFRELAAKWLDWRPPAIMRPSVEPTVARKTFLRLSILQMIMSSLGMRSAGDICPHTCSSGRRAVEICWHPPSAGRSYTRQSKRGGPADTYREPSKARACRYRHIYSRPF